MVENGVIRVVDTPSPGPAPPRRFSVRCCLGIFVLVWLGERVCVCVCTLGMCVRVWLGKEENLWAKACVLQRERKRIYARDLHKDDREHTYRVYE